MAQRVIILSPHFAPSKLAGVHRARHLVRHLPDAGWTPILLCVDPAYHEEPLDPTLADLVPKDIELIRVRALPSRLTRTVGIGDISLRAWTFLRKSLMHALSTRFISVVLITGSPYYPMMLASEIKRRFRIPVVLDFQDPWISSWAAAQPMMTKGAIAYHIAAALEPRALRLADFVTSVSEMQNTELAQRYPWLDTDRMAAIPIGGDPEDFDHLRAHQSSLDNHFGQDGVVEVSYVGSYWPAAKEPIRTLLRGLARMRAANPQLTKKLRLNFIGTFPGFGVEQYQIMPIAEAEGVSDCVRELPARLPYLDALWVMSRSDGLVLIGSTEPHYTASKIYPALMSGRPFVSLFHRASSSHDILSTAGGGRAFAFSSMQELKSLELPLAEALHMLVCTPEIFGTANPGACATYHAAAIARRFGNIFDRLAAERAA